ncbi:MAG: hypothetical protein ACRESZ_16310 [Methylococcales bacterium]
MHDIDRTMMEYEPEMEFEADYEYDESEYTDSEGVLGEAEEMALAAELLGVMDEAELDQFLGKLFKKIGHAAGKFIKSPVGRALGGILKSAAQKALPILGGALGTAIGGPAGGAIGSQLAAKGGQIFGLELEGLSEEDQEFEMARHFVRFAGTAAELAANAPPGVEPKMAAKSAAVTAAQQHAPGLLRPADTSPASMSTMPMRGTMPMMGGGRSGRWIRRGRKIVLLGV